MKSKKTILLIISIVVIIILSIFLVNIKEEEQNKKSSSQNTDYNFVKYQIKEIATEFNSENYSIIDLATNEEDYKSTITKYNIELENEVEKDFRNYNYLLLVIRYDECSEILKEKDISISNNKAVIKYDVQRECGLCAAKYNLYEISLSKKVTSKKDVEIKFNYIDKVHCSTNVAYKPVLYLYPTKPTDIKVDFSNESFLTTTYPKFKDNWQVTAYPNGDLYDSNNNYYYGLYWEEQDNTTVDFSEGFYVTEKEAISFLEEKLTILGLNAKEKNEFIMYWLPILERNKQSLVYFELTEDLQNDNKLLINPSPDTLIRIRIHVKKVSKKQNIKEQNLPLQKRQGFTAVEWGGKLYN